jgi:peptide/nickel transport system permease protein
MVEFGLRLAYSVTLIAGLSFLGFGVQPPTPDWGTMINENRIGLMASPWPVLIPILLIALLTIGMNLLTDALARAMLGGARRVDLASPPIEDMPGAAEREIAVAGVLR